MQGFAPGESGPEGVPAEAGTFDKVIAIEKRLDKMWNIFGVGLAVGVQGNNDIAAGILYAVFQSISLSFARLVEDFYIGAKLFGHLYRSIGGITIDKDDLIYPIWNFGEDMGEVISFVEGTNNNRSSKSYVLCPKSCIPCSVFYVLCSMFYVLS